MKEIYFAAGCFWATEKLFSQTEGVISATSGYANGDSDIIPDYEIVCSNKGRYKETVRVCYDETKVSLRKLVLIYFNVIDPTVKNRQGFDVGIQYQSGIYYIDNEVCQNSASRENCKHNTDLATINEIADIVKELSPVFHVEIQPLDNFFEAEEYHQKYLDKVPGGYCHIPKNKMSDLAEMTENSLEKNLKKRRFVL